MLDIATPMISEALLVKLSRVAPNLEVPRLWIPLNWNDVYNDEFIPLAGELNPLVRSLFSWGLCLPI